MENKRFITVLGFILLLIIVLPIVNYIGGKAGREIIEKFDAAYNNKEEYTFIELAREGCQWCEKQKVIIDDLVANHELKYLYIDTDKINSTQLSYILEKIEVSEDDFGTPTMAIIGKEQVAENIIGYKNEDYIAEKLEKYSIIKDYGFNKLKEISYTEYYKLLKSKTPVVIFLERTDSTKSEYAISQLKRASYETSVQIYSLDVYDVYKAETYPESATDSQKQTAEKFMESLSIYDDGLKTPTVLIVKNGKLIASNTTEYAETSEYVEFLKENKLAK